MGDCPHVAAGSVLPDEGFGNASEESDERKEFLKEIESGIKYQALSYL